jgi:hypothetical protein
MRLMAYCITAFFLIAVAAGSAPAEERFSVLDVYQSHGDVMGVIVTNDPKNKAAGFAVDVVRLNKPKVRVMLGFAGAQDWQKFAQIWLKARRTAPPRQGFGTDIGDYFDRMFNTEITVTVDKDGSITLGIVGKPEGDLVTCLIEIEPKDLGKFDGTVKKVTDYFKE